MTLAYLGDELGKIIRIRQCFELMINGGASATVDSITQLRIEVDAVFDDDATGLQMASSAHSLLTTAQNALNNLMAACDQIAVDVIRNRAVGLINATALSGDIYGLCGEFANYLRDNSKAVLQSTVAAGVVTAGSTNTGSGVPVLSVLNPWADASNNQAVQNQDFSAFCYADSYTGGTAAHAELFKITGSYGHQLTGVQNCLYPAADGSGNVGGGNRLQNEDAVGDAAGTNSDTTICFENFGTSATGIPDGWTKVTGTGGTNINAETTEYYLGAACLEFLGDAGGTLMDISLDANRFFGSTTTDQALQPGARYLVGMYLKVHGSMAGGVIEACLEGTAYTAGATEKATKDFSGTPPTTWTLYTGVAQMPKAIPTDMHFHIRLTTALTNTRECWIDGVFLAKMHYVPQWGCYLHVVGGSTLFVSTPEQPDRFTWSTTNDHAGLFQEWFSRVSDPQDFTRTRYCNLQIPMPASGSASAELAETKAQ